MDINAIIALSTKIASEREVLGPHVQRFTGLLELEDELRKLLGAVPFAAPEAPKRAVTHSMVKNSVFSRQQRAEKRSKLFQFLDACTGQTATIDQMISATNLKRHDITNIIWVERAKGTVQHVAHATYRSVRPA